MPRWKQARGTAMVILSLLILVGCAATSNRESTGESMDDAAITTTVQSSFVADPLVRTAAITVATTRGVVHLSGTVSSEEARHRAIQLTQGVAGVREIVVRNLVVKR